MNKLFELFTTEAREKFLAAISTDEFTSFIEQTKAATDSGNFRVVISTPAVDRQGESVDQNLWDLSNYLNNPVVLWAHDYFSLPIGICTSIQKQDVGGQPVLLAEGKFAPTEFAQQVRKLYEADIVRATSVGFIPATARLDGKSEQGNELLEFSFVPVPANPQALSLSQAQKLGLNVALLATKGIVFAKAEPPAEGDTCALDDGGEGILEEDGNGDLVCVPKPSGEKAKKPPQNDGGNEDGDEAEPMKTFHKVVNEEHGRHVEAVKKHVDHYTKKYEAAESESDKQYAIADCMKNLEGEHAKHLKAIMKAADDLSEFIRDPDVGDPRKSAKAGRTISNATRDRLKAIHDLMVKGHGMHDEAIGALKELIQSAEPQGSEGEDKPEKNGSPKQRSTPAGSADIFNFDDWKFSREVLRAIVTSGAEALERFNITARGQAQRK